jgi:hypothetical protein
MRSEFEVRDRRNGCRLERDAHLHPQNGIDGYRAARLEGWMAALSWVLEEGGINSRGDEIQEHLGVNDEQE